ncbi:hypothetical protein [Sphingomonas alpina]|uniref:hypothetical protein n=1 Tax=Sphingomonas alpina TaxID=653931 RepID=UPI0036F2008E
MAMLAALVFALLPTNILEGLVLDSGIAALVPAAAPPLGVTARAALILIVGGGIGLVSWFSLFLLVGARTISFSGKPVSADTPVLRRADAHPDAPARRPVYANQDLGTPFLEVRARPVHAMAEDSEAIDLVTEPEMAEPEIIAPMIEEAVFEPAPLPMSSPIRAPVVEPLPIVEQAPIARQAPIVEHVPTVVQSLVEQDLPADLDTPLAAYDPAAIPDEPIDWFPPPAQIASRPRPPVFDASERFETFELTPLTRPEPEPVVSVPTPVAPTPRRASDYDSSASIHALLDRLEKGVTRREAVAPIAPPPPPHREESLQEALVSLRRMAMRG